MFTKVSVYSAVIGELRARWLFCKFAWLTHVFDPQVCNLHVLSELQLKRTM